jgi:hypothetical protein
MSRKAVSPEGGHGDLVATRFPRGTKERIAEVAKQHNMTPPQYLRAVLLADLDRQHVEEVAPKAS